LGKQALRSVVRQSMAAFETLQKHGESSESQLTDVLEIRVRFKLNSS
jgi:hypothetical protein